MYRFGNQGLEVLLVHPGGPFWAKRNRGVWSIPKGEFSEDEDLLTVAKREFEEETGFVVEGQFVDLGSITQPSGKIIHAWAVEGDCDVSEIKSNTFLIEWPPRSGKHQEFPEVDRAEWFLIEEARDKILRGQAGFLDELVRKVKPSLGSRTR